MTRRATGDAPNTLSFLLRFAASPRPRRATRGGRSLGICCPNTHIRIFRERADAINIRNDDTPSELNEFAIEEPKRRAKDAFMQAIRSSLQNSVQRNAEQRENVLIWNIYADQLWHSQMCLIRTFVKNALRPPRRNIIGYRVRLARIRLTPKVTQEDLAGRMAGRGIDLKRSAISKIESGIRHVLDYEIKGLAACFKVKPGWFFES